MMYNLGCHTYDYSEPSLQQIIVSSRLIRYEASFVPL